MYRDCPTGKRCFDSEVIAREALVQVRARHGYSESEGPQNVYRCDICHAFHFTSSSANSLSPEEKAREKREREARFWEDKFKNR